MNQSRVFFTLLSIVLLSGGAISSENAFAIGAVTPLPTIESATTISITDISVTFSEPIYNKGGSTGTSYAACFEIDGESVSNASAIPITATGDTDIDTILLSIDTPFGVNDTPNVSYDQVNCTDGQITATRGPSLIEAEIDADDGITPSYTDTPIDQNNENPISIAEELDGVLVRVPLGTSGAIIDDSLELLIGDISFTSAITKTLDATDISNEYYDFEITAGYLDEGPNNITARVTDVNDNVGTVDDANVLILTFDDFEPTHGTLTPATDSFVNDGLSVDFTNNEELASGKIIFYTSEIKAGAVHNHIYQLSNTELDGTLQSISLATLESYPGFGALHDGEVYGIQLTTTDLAGNSATTTNTLITFDTTASNNAPTSENKTITTDEDTLYAFSTDDFEFDDVDGDSIYSVTIVSLPLNGTLTEDGGTVSVDYTISIGDIGDLEFTPTDDENGSGYTSFTFSVTDDNASPETSISYTMTIDVTSVNDAPTSEGNIITADEDHPYTFSPSDFPFTDVDDGDSFDAIQIHPLSGNGVLAFDGIPIAPDTIITGSTSLVSKLVYTPDLNDNGANSASFDYYVHDGTELSTLNATLTIDITPVNDAPTSEDSTVNTDENTSHTFSASNFAFNDVDTGDELISIKVETLPSTGTLILGGISVVAGENISVGLLDRGYLEFKPAVDTTSPPNVTFTFTVSDGELDSETPNTMTINVISDNEPPTASDNTLTTLEDTPLTITAADFGYSDDDPLVSITIQSSIPELTLDGHNVTDLDVISKSNLDANLLVFTPSLNANGDALTEFIFTVNDGESDSVLFYTMEFDVTPVNDAPESTDFTVITDKNTPYTFKAADFPFSDVDGDSLVSVRIFSLPASGSLSVGLVTLAIEDIGELVFTPESDESGSPYTTFQFRGNDGTFETPVRTITINVDVPVIDINEAPVLVSIGNKSIRETSLLTFTATAIDADTPVEDLKYSVKPLPDGASFNETSGVFTWTPSKSQSGSYPITITVTDNDEPPLSDSEEIIITVTNKPSKNGGGCSDCEPPTMGLDSNYKRVVDNGFTYNGNSIDVERFFTPYPLITANIGVTNTAVFKIYENNGIQNIKHLSFAFGLDSDDVISNSKAMIELDIDHEGTETVTITDPKNALDNVKVTTDVVNCMAGSTAQCMEVTINHRFRAPLDFNIVATDLWDQKRNAWQNYFNHGIEVVGESMNPPEEYDGINRGQIYHLTETSKTTAVDEFGNGWSFNHGIWMMDYIQSEQPQDSPTDVFTRMHSEFTQYKESQIRGAIDQLLEICSSCLDDSFTDFDDSFGYDFPVRLNKLQDPEIQQRMILENEKAQKIMNNIESLSDRSSEINSKYFEERDLATILQQERLQQEKPIYTDDSYLKTALKNNILMVSGDVGRADTSVPVSLFIHYTDGATTHYNIPVYNDGSFYINVLTYSLEKLVITHDGISLE